MPAPQLQGTPTSAQSDVAVTSFNISKPAGAAVDRYLFLFCRFNIQTVTFSDLQGFTQAVRINASGANAQYILYRKIDGTEPSTFTFVHTSSTVGALMVAVSNVHLTTPIDDSDGIAQVVTTNTIDLPSLTTTGPNRLLFWAASNLSATTVDWTPDYLDTAELIDTQPAGNSAWAVTQEAQVAAGASGTRTATWGSTGTGQNVACVAITPADDSTPETMRPNTNTGGSTTNLGTYDYTKIDEDPDAPDANWLTGTDPSGSTGSDSNRYADGQDGTTPAGFTGGQLTNPANAVGSAETSQATTTGATQNADYGTNFSFDEAAIASAVPSNATITGVTIEARQWVSSAARGTVGIRIDSAAGTQIANEQTLTTLITAAPAAGTAGTNNSFSGWSTTPTRAQLVAAGLRVRVRARRTASQAWTYNLDWVRMTISYSIPGSTVNTQVDVPLSDPTSTLATGAGTGEIRGLVRKLGSGSDPTARFEVRNAAGTLLATPIADTTVSSTTGVVLSGTFDQSAILNPTDVVVRMVGTGAAGGLVELGAVEWNATTSAQATAGNTRSVLYDVRSLAGNTRGVSYNVSGLAGVSRALSYDIRGLAGNTRGVLYDLRAPAGNQRQIRYDVYSRAGNTRQILYDVLTRAGNSRQVLFDVRALAGNQRGVLYDVRALAGNQRQILYDVLTTVLLAGNARTISYNVNALAGNTRPILFNVSGRAGNQRVVSFDVRGLSGNTRAVLYNVSGRAGNTRQILYDLRAPVGNQRIVLFDVRALTGNTRAIRYDVSGRAGNQRIVSYDLRALATNTRQILYNVSGRSGNTRVISYNISSLAGNQRPILYNVSGRAGNQRVVLYDVLSAILVAGNTRAIRYDVRALAGNTRLVLFNINTLVGNQRQMLYNVSGRSGNTRQIRYDLRALAGNPRPVLYDVRALSGNQRGVLYDVYGRAGNQRVIRYDLYALAGAIRQIRYNTLGLAGNQRTILYDVEFAALPYELLLLEIEVLHAAGLSVDAVAAGSMEKIIEAPADLDAETVDAAELAQDVIKTSRLEPSTWALP